jgi:hypothetical protein
MGPDRIRENDPDRKRQQDNKDAFHTILGGTKLRKCQLSA